MPLIVAGTGPQRARVQTLLARFCFLADVNSTTGVVTRLKGQPTAADIPGCCCLDNLITSGFTTTIVPLGGPDTPIPGRGDTTIGQTLGGSTRIPPAGRRRDGPGGKVNGPGAGATTYLDITDNNDDGYYVHDGDGNRIDDPLFIILFHELCTGHASQSIQGVADPDDRESAAIACENTLRDARVPPYTQRVGTGGGRNRHGDPRAPR